MAAATAPVLTLTPAELHDRRLAVESTIGTMRLSDMEPDNITQKILYNYANGKIDLEEISRQLHEYAATIL
jgi:hypothetical protein